MGGHLAGGSAVELIFDRGLQHTKIVAQGSYVSKSTGLEVKLCQSHETLSCQRGGLAAMGDKERMARGTGGSTRPLTHTPFLMLNLYHTES